MKQSLVPALAAVALAVFSAPGGAAEKMPQGDRGAVGATKKTPSEVPLVDGLVKKVDKATGLLTLTHGPLPNGMPAMTMGFRVREAAWLDKLEAGQKIRFAAEPIDGTMTVVRFESGR